MTYPWYLLIFSIIVQAFQCYMWTRSVILAQNIFDDYKKLAETHVLTVKYLHSKYND